MVRVTLKVVTRELPEGDSADCLGTGLTGILKKRTWKSERSVESINRGTFLQVLMGKKGCCIYGYSDGGRGEVSETAWKFEEFGSGLGLVTGPVLGNNRNI